MRIKSKFVSHNNDSGINFYLNDLYIGTSIAASGTTNPGCIKKAKTHKMNPPRIQIPCPKVASEATNASYFEILGCFLGYFLLFFNIFSSLSSRITTDKRKPFTTC